MCKIPRTSQIPLSEFSKPKDGAFLKGGDLNPGERHSRDTRDDGTVTLCTLRAATVLSRDCRADFGRPLTKKVMSHSRDGPGVTAPSQTNIVPLTGVWNPPPFRYPPLKSPRKEDEHFRVRARTFRPPPLRVEDPLTPPGGLRTQKVSLCAPFSCLPRGPGRIKNTTTY